MTYLYLAHSPTPSIYSSYTPDLKCETDGNGYGLVNASVGLITYDELRLAGASQYDNIEYYLYKELYFPTMSPAGMDTENYFDDDTGDPIEMPSIWSVYGAGGIYSIYSVTESQVIVPVINLKNAEAIQGTGTSTNPYVIQ